MRAGRIGLIVTGLVLLATTALFVFGPFRGVATPAPSASTRATPAPAPVLAHDIVGEYPHDPNAYTQGLIYLDGFLYESTGITRKSSLRKVRLETGEIVQQRAVNPRDFGEGLTEWHGRLLQLTPRRRGSAPPWHLRTMFEDVQRHFGNQAGVTYDLATLAPRTTFEYAGEGWGLTHDDHRLIMSDGSSVLRFLHPGTFAELSRLPVFDGNRPVDHLNELEYAGGKLYANVLPQERIAIIEPATGQVTAWIDLTELKSRMPPLPTTPLRAVMNGIAYDAGNRRLLVTGKFWPKVFAVRVRQP